MTTTQANTLFQLVSGKDAVIQGIQGDTRLKQRLAEMGFVNGAKVTANQTAPMGDPRTYTIRGYQISLREEEARQIVLESDFGGGTGESVNDAHGMNLMNLVSGESGVIQGIRGDFRLKQRLAEMGFVQGAKVTAEQTAPMGDPRTYTIRGYQISLRREEARQILLAA